MAKTKGMAILIIIFALFLFTGCSSGAAEPIQVERSSDDISHIYNELSQGKLLVYYMRDNYLTPLTISINPTEEPAKEALTRLFYNPAPEGFINTLYGIKLNDFSIAGNMALLDVSREFLNDEVIKPRIDQLLFTLTKLRDIQKVKVTIENDLEEIYERPQYINAMVSSNATSSDFIDTQSFNNVTVYYADKDTKYLVPITINSDKISLTINDDGNFIPPTPQQKAEAALQHLLQGPKDFANLTGIFPENIKPKFYIKDATAYVDVSKEMLFGLRDKAEYEKMAVESIVLTLTSIEDIEKVQFLVDGNIIGSIAGHINISYPISRPQWYNYYR